MTVRGILCDLDGVVYRGEIACPGAVEGLAEARARGAQLLFMTNNASRTPEVVAAQISGLGLPTAADEVLGASQVAAQHLRQLVEDGVVELGDRLVMALGGPGVGAALAEAGLDWMAATDVRDEVTSQRVGAVVQGYGPGTTPHDLAEAAYAIGRGAFWLATNDDATLPTARGFAPGNGSYVALLAHATGRTPDRVTGKPHAPAYEVALERLGRPREECLMIGDRLDTDIAGARAAGLRSAMVLTGVSTREEAEAAPETHRPDRIVGTIPELADLWD